MPKAKVITLPVVTRLNLDPDRVLKGAIGKMEGVIIIGYDKEGYEYFVATYADGGEALWLLERCKMALLKMGDGNA